MLLFWELNGRPKRARYYGRLPLTDRVAARKQHGSPSPHEPDIERGLSEDTHTETYTHTHTHTYGKDPAQENANAMIPGITLPPGQKATADPIIITNCLPCLAFALFALLPHPAPPFPKQYRNENNSRK